MDDEPAASGDSLLERLRPRIRAEGPLTVSAYMAEALYDPTRGYYAVKDPIGAGADYVTAPEISQMFGELIGLWCVQSWMEMGAPDRLRLIELGPGRGTLMKDALRAVRIRAEFLEGLAVTLVEASPALQSVQALMLSEAPVLIDWARELPAKGGEPAIILANEFVDCLPVRQFVKQDGVWRERLVGLAPEDSDARPALAFVLSPAPASDATLALAPRALLDAPEGALVEARPSLEPLMETLAQRLTGHGGRALFIDYGPAHSEPGDTLQSVRGHEKTDPLAAPGEQDLTARVDFRELARLARTHGLDVAGPIEQGAWLARLGLERRAAALIQNDPDAKGRIASQVFRLTDPGQMGALFKVLCVSAPGLPPAAGFA